MFESTARNGVSILGLLGVVFVTLKLLGVASMVTWSWWLVTAPFWGGFAAITVIFAGWSAFLVTAWLVESVHDWAFRGRSIRSARAG